MHVGPGTETVRVSKLPGRMLCSHEPTLRVPSARLGVCGAIAAASVCLQPHFCAAMCPHVWSGQRRRVLGACQHIGPSHAPLPLSQHFKFGGNDAYSLRCTRGYAVCCALWPWCGLRVSCVCPVLFMRTAKRHGYVVHHIPGPTSS